MSNFDETKEQYASIGIDVESAIQTLEQTPISIHCWQGDDVSGFETSDTSLGNGLAVTGNYPGKANNIQELRQDLEMVYSLLPGNHRLNLHAIYGDFEGQKIDRDAITVEHFQSWIDWCRSLNIGMDFNPSCFAHDKASSGFTLSHPDQSIRDFWIEHCKRSRSIASEIGKQLGSTSFNNLWIPDGMKDMPADRLGYRNRLLSSLDKILEDTLDEKSIMDVVESKLFGIGSESFVVGSHEFYLGYAIRNNIALCLDAGHFHPTESIADKISSISLYVNHLLLHVSRGVRWDSDHVVLLDDATQAIMNELVASNVLNRTRIGLDFFDASINRIAAWVIGTRSTQKALLIALLTPHTQLQEAENNADYTTRLATKELVKSMPWCSVWDEFCARQNVASEMQLMSIIHEYEQKTLSNRN